FLSLGPKDRVIGQYRVERIDRADIRNIPIAIWSFGLPSDDVPIVHAIPLNESPVRSFDLDTDWKAVAAAIHMPAQFISAAQRAIVAPCNKSRLAVRVRSRADRQRAILSWCQRRPFDPIRALIAARLPCWQSHSPPDIISAFNR